MDWKTRRNLEEEQKLKESDETICKFCGGKTIYSSEEGKEVVNGYHEKCRINAIRLERNNA